MTDTTDTDRQELRRWCIELAATEPTKEFASSNGARQIVATAATYEDFILNGAQSKELDALFTKVESAWEVRENLACTRRYQQNELRKKEAQLIAAAQAFATTHEPQQGNPGTS